MDPHTPDEERRTSSVYSGVSSTAARLNPHGNGIGQRIVSGGSHSRPGSHASSIPLYVPSYMSHVPSRSQASNLSLSVPNGNGTGNGTGTGNGNGNGAALAHPAPIELPANEISIMAPRGQLLVLAAGVIHESTLSNIEMLVSRQDFSGIVLVASQEQETSLKALKMSCFALIGRLSKEMSVSTHFQEEWSHRDVERTVGQITNNGESIQGVLCSPAFLPQGTDLTDILDMVADDMQQAWRTSVAFVQGAAQATLRHLLSRCKVSGIKSSRAPRGPFMLVSSPPAYSPASQIAKSACDSLLAKLNEATKPLGLTIAYAEHVLVPDPVQVEETSQATSGPFLQPTEMQPAQQDFDYASPESPTKLWALWSGAADV